MIQDLILSHLALDHKYARKVLPYIKEEYFPDYESQFIIKAVNAHMEAYNESPSKDVLKVEFDQKGVFKNPEGYEAAIKLVDNLTITETTDRDWLVTKTEEFCRESAIHNALMDSIQIHAGEHKNKNLDKGAIPQLLEDALSVSFDTDVGHEYGTDYLERYRLYTMEHDRIPFDLHYLNTVTRGGLFKKTLNVFMAGPGVGKSMLMCHCAAAHLSRGYNVLYITLEMAEDKIAERIDANLLDVEIDQLSKLSASKYEDKVKKVINRTEGRLVIKEYPTSSAGVQHFRTLMTELRRKRKFVPDIIYIDYINIATSSRLKLGSGVNSYGYIKAIAEEFRGFAAEYNVPVVTATQINREGIKTSDMGMEHTSESFGLPATADIMLGLSATGEVDSLDQILVTQVKNRYADVNYYKRFVLGVDRSKMRFFDLEETAQYDIVKIDDTEDRQVSDKFDQKKLEGFF